MEETNVKSNIEKLELYSDEHPFNLSLRISRFENETDFNKFVKNVEMIVRKSIEYKDWRTYIIDVLGVNTCMITNERMDEVTIEVHHHVPGLFTVVKALVNRKLDKTEHFSTFDIALEAIELHFMNKIGYATLLKSMHEKFHNGFLEIPIEYVKGDYMWFIKEFAAYLDDEDLNTINSRVATNESNTSWIKNNYQDEKKVAVN